MTTADLSDDILSAVVDEASKLINAHMNIRVKQEVLKHLGDDETNTIFYVKHTPIGDTNNDFTADTSDVKVYDDLLSNDPNELTVSEVDRDTGKITLAAGRTGAAYIFYSYSKYELDSIEVVEAATVVASKLAWDREMGGIESFRMGPLSQKKVNRFNIEYKEALSNLTPTLKESKSVNRIFQRNPPTYWWNVYP